MDNTTDKIYVSEDIVVATIEKLDALREASETPLSIGADTAWHMLATMMATDGPQGDEQGLKPKNAYQCDRRAS